MTPEEAAVTLRAALSGTSEQRIVRALFDAESEKCDKRLRVSPDWDTTRRLQGHAEMIEKFRAVFVTDTVITR